MSDALTRIGTSKLLVLCVNATVMQLLHPLPVTTGATLANLSGV